MPKPKPPLGSAKMSQVNAKNDITPEVRNQLVQDWLDKGNLIKVGKPAQASGHKGARLEQDQNQART